MRVFLVGLILLGCAIGGLGQGWAPRDPIYIHGDQGFTWENGVVKGSGTPEDPYIIEGWVIDTRSHDYGIYIDGTRAHFVIRNCQIRYPQERAGIFLSNVQNGRIEGNAIFGGKIAIHLLASQNVVITGNAIGYCDYGILVSFPRCSLNFWIGRFCAKRQARCPLCGRNLSLGEKVGLVRMVLVRKGGLR